MRSLRAGRQAMSVLSPWHHRLRWLAAVGLSLAAFFAPDTSAALAAGAPMRASDWKSIKQVIAAQRAALISGEGEKAFGYATPALRAQFGRRPVQQPAYEEQVLFAGQQVVDRGELPGDPDHRAHRAGLAT